MIMVTKLNGDSYYLNPHHIESIEALPDTTVLLQTGKRLVVKEKPDIVVDRIIAYRRRLGEYGNEE